ncbi:integrator complex subunit 15-like [Amphiura filiformis]|uniref:integrator complex subunit 15-like n=1 Tax=Amphiura filiformis TaxID=82378 RepID=UPI003B221913
MGYDNHQNKMAAYRDKHSGPVCLWYSNTPQRMPELRDFLSHQELPVALFELFSWFEKYFIQCENFPPGKFPNKECVSQLIAEFVFNHPEGSHKRPNPLRELRLLEELCHSLKEMQHKEEDSEQSHHDRNQDMRHVLFEGLFGCNPKQLNKVDEYRLEVLGKLVSLAISIKSVSVLECAAIWIYNQGFSPVCTTLVSRLVEDYCTLVPGSLGVLGDLVQVCPQFTSQFLTAVMYVFNSNTDKGAAILPESLLELVTTWVTDSPLLCIEHITNRLPHVPSFYTPIKQQTHPDILYLSNRGPIAGLVHCCVIAPLLSAQNGAMESGNPLEEPSRGTKTGLMFSKLFLGVLQSMLYSQAELARLKYIRCPEMITTESIKRMVQNVSKLIKLKHLPLQSEEVQMALDRFAQAIQVALATGVIHSSRDKLVNICSGLPENRLLHLVLHHKDNGKIAPGAMLQVG